MSTRTRHTQMGCCASAAIRERRGILGNAKRELLDAIRCDDDGGVRRVLRYTPGLLANDRIPREQRGVWWTALHAAARYSATRCIDALLSAGADVDAMDSRGWAPSHYAVVFQTEPAPLDRLLRAGASRELRTHGGGHLAYRGTRIQLSGKTCMELAAALCRYDTCEQLEAHEHQMRSPRRFARKISPLPTAPPARLCVPFAVGA